MLCVACADIPMKPIIHIHATSCMLVTYQGVHHTVPPNGPIWYLWDLPLFKAHLATHRLNINLLALQQSVASDNTFGPPHTDCSSSMGHLVGFEVRNLPWGTVDTQMNIRAILVIRWDTLLGVGLMWKFHLLFVYKINKNVPLVNVVCSWMECLKSIENQPKLFSSLRTKLI